MDENANVLVYNQITKEKIFEEKNANSVSWNSEFEDMFCYRWGRNGIAGGGGKESQARVDRGRVGE